MVGVINYDRVCEAVPESAKAVCQKISEDQVNVVKTICRVLGKGAFQFGKLTGCAAFGSALFFLPSLFIPEEKFEKYRKIICVGQIAGGIGGLIGGMLSESKKVNSYVMAILIISCVSVGGYMSVKQSGGAFISGVGFLAGWALSSTKLIKYLTDVMGIMTARFVNWICHF